MKISQPGLLLPLLLLLLLAGWLVGWSIGNGPGESESGGVGLGPALWAGSLEDSPKVRYLRHLG